MKRLLILAYDFPPYVSVGGLRPYAWHKYLKEFGVEPVVVTRQWGNAFGNELDYIAPGSSDETIVEESECGTIIRTPYKPNLANRIMLKYGKNHLALVRKAVTAFYEFAQYPFFVGPKSCIYRGAKKYLKNNKVDAILATGEPFVLFKYASALSKKHNIPWIADYRDPWVQNKNRSQFMGRWNAFFERNYLKNAAAVTTVSDFFKKKIGENVSFKKSSIIINGFNPEAIKLVSHVSQQSDKLRIAFAGTIYDWHPYKNVLSIVAEFAQDRNIELNFFGINRPDEISQLIAENHWKEFVHIFPRMRNAELLEQLCLHNAMLLFNDYSFIGTKIYDYLAIKRKILLCYSNDKNSNLLKTKYYPYSHSSEEDFSNHLQEDCLNHTQAGIVVENEEHLRKVLSELYDEFCRNGSIKCASQNLEQYSRKHGAKLLAELIHSIA